MIFSKHNAIKGSILFVYMLLTYILLYNFYTCVSPSYPTVIILLVLSFIGCNFLYTCLSKSRNEQCDHFQNIFECNTTPMIIIEMKFGVITYANKSFKELIGIENFNNISDINNWLPIVNQKNYITKWKELIRGSYCGENIELPFLLLDRRILIVNITTSIYKNEKYEFLICSFQDITYFKKQFQRINSKFIETKKVQTAKYEFLFKRFETIVHDIDKLNESLVLLFESFPDKLALQQRVVDITNSVKKIEDFLRVELNLYKDNNFEDLRVIKTITNILKNFVTNVKSVGHECIVSIDKRKLNHLLYSVYQLINRNDISVTINTTDRYFNILNVMVEFELLDSVRIDKTLFDVDADYIIDDNWGDSQFDVYIIRNMIDHFNGKIWVETSSNTTKVYVTLNIKVSENDSIIKHSLGQKSIDDVRVLIADDNNVNVILFDKIMNQIGCIYKIVSNGEELLRELELAEYDIILTDIQMPEMDGYQVVNIIRNSKKKYSTIPIFFVTAHETDDDVVNHKVTGIVPKPIHKKDIVDLIETLRENKP